MSALFDIAGTIGKSKPAGFGGDDDEEEAAGFVHLPSPPSASTRSNSLSPARRFPFLIMPANVLQESLTNKDGEAVDLPGPLRVSVRRDSAGAAVAEIVTTSLLDVHLADEVMQPQKKGMANPLVRLKATIVETIAMDVKSAFRERSLRLSMC